MRQRPTMISRRDFLARAGCLLGGASWLAAFDSLALMRTAFAATTNASTFTDHKSLVCIFLFGGNDSFNMTVPTAQADYDKYARVRQTLALPHGQLIPVNGSSWSFHPSGNALRTLYNEGALGVVANVGSLFAPLTVADYETKPLGVPIPPDLFSHSDQTDLWQSNRAAAPGARREGWGGLIADTLQSANTNPDVPSIYTLNGENLWQVGVNSESYGIRPGQGIPSFEAFDFSNYPNRELGRSTALQAILQQSRVNVLERQAANSMAETARKADLLRAALDGAPTLTTAFDLDNNDLARQLHTVARLIAIRASLGIQRQIFFVGVGGFDTHSSQLPAHANLMANLSDGLNSFYRATQELGVADTVTTFTASEFGRTLTSNGDGTDHAWAADALVLGGAVRGGVMHGTPVQYDATPVESTFGEQIFGPADVGAGRFIPHWSVDQYGATLARWMGISDADLLTIFPNLHRFTERDLGFMQTAPT